MFPESRKAIWDRTVNRSADGVALLAARDIAGRLANAVSNYGDTKHPRRDCHFAIRRRPGGVLQPAGRTVIRDVSLVISYDAPTMRQALPCSTHREARLRTRERRRFATGRAILHATNLTGPAELCPRAADKLAERLARSASTACVSISWTRGT